MNWHHWIRVGMYANKGPWVCYQLHPILSVSGALCQYREIRWAVKSKCETCIYPEKHLVQGAIKTFKNCHLENYRYKMFSFIQEEYFRYSDVHKLTLMLCWCLGLSGKLFVFSLPPWLQTKMEGVFLHQFLSFQIEAWNLELVKRGKCLTVEWIQRPPCY